MPLALLFAAGALIGNGCANPPRQTSFLTDPFLQNPQSDSVRVAWFTEFKGSEHGVLVGTRLERTIYAATSRLTRIRDDRGNRPRTRQIWRHEAVVNNLAAGSRLPYRVFSQDEAGRRIYSRRFSLSPSPRPETPLTVLLTSDHQLKPMTAANIQRAQDTAGRVDAVFFAGDLVNIPDRAADWFDAAEGNAFFPVLQGHARYALKTGNAAVVYRGAEILQHAPVFPAIGNHEVMGRWSPRGTLTEQFNNAVPRSQGSDPAEPFSTQTYEEIFSLPGNERYWATTFGDIRLVSLFATRIWREEKFKESPKNAGSPDRWTHGSHIFEPITPSSPQLKWLRKETSSPAWRNARLRVVLLHHPIHTLGENGAPPFTDPIQTVERDAKGRPVAVRYEYPADKDYLALHVAPLLEEAGAHLVLNGHSHLYNRFKQGKTHYLESSNVGNTYGAHREKSPQGLAPVVPNRSPRYNESGKALAHLSSNQLSVFSLLDTDEARVRSYYVDTAIPDAAPVLFDEFKISE